MGFNYVISITFSLEVYFPTRAMLSRHASILNAMAIYRRKLENQKLYPRVYNIDWKLNGICCYLLVLIKIGFEKLHCND